MKMSSELEKIIQEFSENESFLEREEQQKWKRDVFTDIYPKLKLGTYKFSVTDAKKKKYKERDIWDTDNTKDKIVFKLLANNLKRYCDRDMGKRDVLIKHIKELLISKQYQSVYRTDFQNFYGNINQKLLYDVVIKEINIDVYEKLFLEYMDFIKKMKCVGIPAGLSPSNMLAEIYAKYLELKIRENFKKEIDIKFYRYVDDILIFIKKDEEREVSEEDVCSVLNNSVENAGVFNKEKSKFISLNNEGEVFNYLGYSFICGSNDVEIGIDESKCQKINKKLMDILTEYRNNIEKSNGDLNKLIMSDRIFHEKIQYYFSYKVYKKNSIIYSGISYTYKEITNFNIIDKETIATFMKIISELNHKPMYLNYHSRSKMNIALGRLYDVEKWFKKKNKYIFLNRPNYFNKSKMLSKIKMLSFFEENNEYNEVKNKSYYCVYKKFVELINK